MITKETNIYKYCCFYVSDFHLEMILLPYISKKIKEKKVKIITEKSLEESINVLIEKVNLNTDKKKEILNLNWNNKDINSLKRVNSSIIINGSENFINQVHKKININNLRNIDIVDCYNLNEVKQNAMKIKNKYNEILNTQKI